MAIRSSRRAGVLKGVRSAQDADGTLGTITNVITLQQTQEMFNLTVSEAHTYYVGTQGWLVHNCAIKSFFTGRKDALKDLIDRGRIDKFEEAEKPFGVNLKDDDVIKEIEDTFGSSKNWKKGMWNGYDQDGKEISLHYFYNDKLGTTWGMKSVPGHSYPDPPRR